MQRQIALYVAILFTAVLLLPSVAFAQSVQITEIMYNLEGTDADREWVEIRNTSGSDIDLSAWHLLENDVNHLLSASGDGGTVLAANSYAVIADDPTAFLGDHPGVKALVLDSSFGLSNSGEDLSITDADEVVVDSYTYTPDTGADGDGNSLQLSDGDWIAADPTPGEVNASIAAADSSSSDSRIRMMEPRTEPPDPVGDISIDAGSDVPALASLPVDLVGTIDGIEERRLDELDYSWSFGNGDDTTGRDVTYVYPYPGSYVATFRVVADDGDIYTDATVVEVLDPAVSIIDVSDDYITIKNTTGRSVDLSGWGLMMAGKAFAFPLHTIHLDDEELTITEDVSGLSGTQATLYFPDGRTANTYKPQAEDSSRSTTVSRRTYTPQADQPVDNQIDSAQSTTTNADQDVSLDDTFAATSDQSAAAMASLQSDRLMGSFWRWGGVLFLLLMIALITAILMRRISRPADDPEVQASRFDINEIKD